MDKIKVDKFKAVASEGLRSFFAEYTASRIGLDGGNLSCLSAVLMFESLITPIHLKLCLDKAECDLKTLRPFDWETCLAVVGMVDPESYPKVVNDLVTVYCVASAFITHLEYLESYDRDDLYKYYCAFNTAYETLSGLLCKNYDEAFTHTYRIAISS